MGDGKPRTLPPLKCSASSWVSDPQQASSHCPAVSSYSSCSRTGYFLLLKQADFGVPERKNMSYLDFYHFASSQEVGKGMEEK